jgi:hypothetical protein
METPSEKTIGFGINDMPLWLFRAFKEECRKVHNDVHWVTLLSWYEKARAYEAIMSGTASIAVPMNSEPTPVQEEKEDDEPQGVMTIGGLVKGR